MEMTIGDFTCYSIKHDDKGQMMRVFHEHRLHCDYDYVAGEYFFYDEVDYHAALLLV